MAPPPLICHTRWAHNCDTGGFDCQQNQCVKETGAGPCVRPNRIVGRTNMAPPPVIALHPGDGVVIARATLLAGTPVADGVVASARLPAGGGARGPGVWGTPPPTPPGHRVPPRAYAKGEPIRRYGQIIGFA